MSYAESSRILSAPEAQGIRVSRSVLVISSRIQSSDVSVTLCSERKFMIRISLEARVSPEQRLVAEVARFHPNGVASMMF